MSCSERSGKATAASLATQIKTAARIAPDEDTRSIAQSVVDKLYVLGLDPLIEMAKYAFGDVVGLGLMTNEEYEAEEECDPDTGVIVFASGKHKAVDLIPPRLRAEMVRELTKYIHHARRPALAAEIEDEDEDWEDEEERVVVYVPDNGRKGTAVSFDKVEHIKKEDAKLRKKDKVAHAAAKAANRVRNTTKNQAKTTK